MHILGVAMVVVALSMAAACSNRQVYEAIQKNQQLECQKFPDAQYEKCMQELSEPYDQYQRERDEVIEGDRS